MADPYFSEDDQIELAKAVQRGHDLVDVFGSLSATAARKIAAATLDGSPESEAAALELVRRYQIICDMAAEIESDSQVAAHTLENLKDGRS